MLTTRPCMTLMGAAILAITSTQAAYAGRSACETSAKLMSKSCRHEVREEYHATLAACGSILDKEEREGCKEDAKDEKSDARETCDDLLDARDEACELLAEDRYADPLTEQGVIFIDPDEIGTVYDNNPYVILQAGHTHVLQAEDEIVVVYATEEVREIQGVLCRVVADVVVAEEFDEEEQEWEYTAIEVTDDWFAQDIADNVYYCGEVARNFEDGVLRDLDGSFESGVDLAKGGILTLAMPSPGDVHRTEYALGEAEDIVQYMLLNTSPGEDEGGDVENFPCDGNCLKTFDFSPLEPESTEYKYYLPGTGFVLAVSLEDGEIDEDGREELVCSGDSLDVLMSEDCDIEDPLELLEDLCDYHDEFCGDDDDLIP